MNDATLALIALGSNLPSAEGSPARTVTAAMAELSGLGRVLSRSRLWKSPAWPPGRPDYVNAAVLIETGLSPEEALGRLHAIEATFGRTREARWGARTLDLDLLAMGGLVRPDAETQAAWRGLDAERQGREAPDRLILPHPRMHERAFVLVPLHDVAPGWRHPLLGRTVAEMRDGLPPERLAEVAPL